MAVHGVHRAIGTALLMFLVGAAAAGIAAAQATPGEPPFSSLAQVPEGRLDLADLNIHSIYPVLLKGGLIPFDFLLSSNSLVNSPTGGAWSAGAMLVHSADATVGVASPDRTVQALCPGEKSTCVTYGTCTWVNEYSQWEYDDRLGTPHPLQAGTVYDYSACPYPGTGSYTATLAAADSSGWNVTVNAAPQGVSAVDVHGNIYDLQADTVTDPNGNKISCCWTDTLGTTALTESGSGTASSPLVYTYTDADNNTRTVTVKWEAYTVRTNYGCSGVSEFGPTTLDLVSEIDLPDGTSYKFTYEPTPGYPNDVTSRPASIQLPTGGTISYQYSGGSNGITCSDGIPATLTRTTPDGKWTYQHTESGSAWTTLVTDPAGNQTYYQFQGLYQTEADVYQGSKASGQLLETVYTCYNGASAPCNSTGVTAPITSRARMTCPPRFARSRV